MNSGRVLGPKTNAGALGKELDICETLPLAIYKKIENVGLPANIEDWDLRDDQKYLYEISMAIHTGMCSEELATKKPGKQHNARWMTKASRYCRLYVSKAKPTKNLIDIVTYIQKVYVGAWFRVKEKPLITSGSLHLFNFIKSIRVLPAKIFAEVKKSVLQNGYFANEENILLGMINDENKSIQVDGFQKILQARTRRNENLREFRIPPINFDCNSYVDMIFWDQIIVHEPPFTKNISDEEIIKYMQSEEKIEVPPFPCHSQAVEALVQTVSTSSGQVLEDTLDGHIKNKLYARSICPRFNSKKDFKAK